MRLTKQLIENILVQVDKASKAILDIYQSLDLEIETKKDNSPVTLADKVSQDILALGLAKLCPGIPLISEEAKIASYQERKNWDYFWLVDPLDGTKEFIAKRKEFTVNVALIKKNRPVLGVIAIPKKKLTYFAARKKGSYKKKAKNIFEQIKIKEKRNSKIIVARSRSHRCEKEEELISKIGPVKTILTGSSLKFCLVAEGKADIYLRSGPTMEWDTAAGQCIAAQAGAKTYTFSGEPLFYNKKSLLNPGLICTAREGLLR